MRKFMMILTSFLALFSCGNKANGAGDVAAVKPIQSYCYRENGTSAQPNCDFTVERVDDKTCRLIKFRFDTESYTETYDTIPCPVQLLNEIEAVVAEHKMASYKENYQSIFEVMDGTSWSMRIKFTDGTKVSSYGSNAGPGDDGLRIIEDLINKTVNNNK